MRVAIIGGTGIYRLAGVPVEPQAVETRYGRAEVFIGQGDAHDLVFIARHGVDHRIPPHRINYRANLKALEQLGVERILATFAVGSLHRRIPPRSLVALDQFIDATHGREATFFDGGATGVVHTDMTEPYCPALRARLLEAARERGLKIRPWGTYVCTSGPRFETAAEVRMFARLGGDVVGMTGVPEVVLARELGIHYAAVALSINWGAGVRGPLQIEERGLDDIRAALLTLFIEVLRTPSLPDCGCASARMVVAPPEGEADSVR